MKIDLDLSKNYATYSNAKPIKFSKRKMAKLIKQCETIMAERKVVIEGDWALRRAIYFDCLLPKYKPFPFTVSA